MKAQVVYERNEAFDMQAGPYGYERVGFRVGDRIFWTGCSGSHSIGGTFAEDKLLADRIVRALNREGGGET